MIDGCKKLQFKKVGRGGSKKREREGRVRGEWRRQQGGRQLQWWTCESVYNRQKRWGGGKLTNPRRILGVCGVFRQVVVVCVWHLVGVRRKKRWGGQQAEARAAPLPGTSSVRSVGGASHAGHALKKRGGENTNTHKTRLAWRVQHALRATRAKTREQGGREGGSSRHTHKHHYSACAREARERREGGDKRARAHTD